MDSIKVNWEILLSLIWWVGTISSGRSVERNLELFLFQKMPWQPFRRKGNKHRPLTEVSILSLPKELESQVQGLWPKFPFVCLPLHQGLVFPGWRWDLFCTRNDCAAQLQRRKPCQVSFGRFAWNRIWGFYSDSGHRVNVYCWEIGLLSAATAHAAVPPAIGQVSLSE